MLLQDPGRYLVRERADEEVALGSDLPRARQMLAALGLAGSEARHPRDLSTGERERLHNEVQRYDTISAVQSNTLRRSRKYKKLPRPLLVLTSALFGDADLPNDP